MKRLITLFFVILRLTCLAQSKTDDYTLTIDFAPSFISTSKLVIHSAQDSNHIQLTIYNHYKDVNHVYTNKVRLKAKYLDGLTSFLQTYQFKIRGNVDTLGSHKVLENGDSVLVYSVSMGVDGITVSGVFDQTSTSKKFQFWSPKKDTANDKLVIILFDLMNKAFKDNKSTEYLRRLKGYF
jgi:hypothetical protein